MDAKIKILLVCLGIISLVVVGSSMWVYYVTQGEFVRYAQKQVQLEEESAGLREELDVAQEESLKWREKSEAVTAALNKLSNEYALIEAQYASLVKEKDLLIQDKQGLSAELDRAKELYEELLKEKEALPAALDLDRDSDQYLSSLLKEKASLQVEVEALKKEIEAAQEQREPSENMISQLKQQLRNAQGVSQVLSNDLLQVRKDSDFAVGELQRVEEQLKEVLEERDELSLQLTKMQQALEDRLAEVNRTKELLENAVRGAKDMASKERQAASSIELTPIIVKADTQERRFSRGIDQERTLPAQKLDQPSGRIITVNQEHRFVVINVGKEHGVETGMTFDVYRQGQKVGEVEVIETRKSIAACDIKEAMGRGLQINDTVMR